MNRNLILADLFLVVLVILGGLRIRSDWKQFEGQHNVESIQPKSNPVAASPALMTSTPQAPAYWKEIADRNVFSFDRSDIPAVASVTSVPRPNKPTPFLFGTMALGGPLMAMVGPGSPGNRSYRAMGAGDVIDGWTLVQVNDKSIVVESAGERQTVLMNDPSAQIPRDYSRTMGSAQNAAISARPVVPETGRAASPTAQPGAARVEAAAPRTRTISTPFGDKVITEP